MNDPQSQPGQAPPSSSPSAQPLPPAPVVDAGIGAFDERPNEDIELKGGDIVDRKAPRESAETPKPRLTAPDNQIDPQVDDPTAEFPKRWVDLARLVVDEFGMSEHHAIQMVGSGVTFDGEPFDGDPRFVPYEDIEGKHVIIEGDVRSVSFSYKG